MDDCMGELVSKRGQNATPLMRQPVQEVHAPGNGQSTGAQRPRGGGAALFNAYAAWQPGLVLWALQAMLTANIPAGSC